MNTPSFAIKNIRRKPWRSGALIMAMGLAAALLFTGAVSIKGVLTSIRFGTQRLGADLMVVPAGQEKDFRASLLAGRPSPFYMPAKVLDQIRQVKGVRRASPQLFLKSSSYACCSPVDALLIAFDPETDFTVGPWLNETLKRPLGRDEVIIGRKIPVMTGSQLSFYGKAFTVAGYMAATGIEYIDHGVFMTFATAREMIAGAATKSPEPLNINLDALSTVMVELDPEITPERAAVFVEYEVSGVKAIPSQDVIGTVKKHLGVLVRMIVAVGVALWLITLILIAVVFSMTVNERQREIGLLRAMGATRKTVFWQVTVEAFFIAALGGLGGISLGAAALALLREPVAAAFNLPYLWPGSVFVAAAAAATLVIAVLSGTAAALYPAFRCSRMQPYEAIRQGE